MRNNVISSTKFTNCFTNTYYITCVQYSQTVYYRHKYKHILDFIIFINSMTVISLYWQFIKFSNQKPFTILYIVFIILSGFMFIIIIITIIRKCSICIIYYMAVVFKPDASSIYYSYSTVFWILFSYITDLIVSNINKLKLIFIHLIYVFNIYKLKNQLVEEEIKPIKVRGSTIRQELNIFVTPIKHIFSIK